MTRNGGFIAVIPARGGSKGVVNKNIRSLDGKPLLAYSIETAKECGRIERVIVSTDSQDIAQIARTHGAEVVLRPAQLASDSAPTEPVMLHALDELRATDNFEPEYVVLLQPTSPYRKQGTLDRCIDHFFNERADSLLTVCESHSFFWERDNKVSRALYDFKNRPRRQDIPDRDRRYRENGSVYITRTSLLLSEKNRLGGSIALYPMSEEESYEIDSPFDFWLLEQIIQNGNSGADYERI